ncbi:hypothetical protein, partial [Candidatus Cardinium hertigii]|uniref:hypothetical protein n=1 Tax=Candidatus Cardinium hertigii TaxID=247481 RepID=UPI001FAA0507
RCHSGERIQKSKQKIKASVKSWRSVPCAARKIELARYTGLKQACFFISAVKGTFSIATILQRALGVYVCHSSE